MLFMGMEEIWKLEIWLDPLIKFLAGDGSNIYMWHDNWHPDGPLN